MTEIGKIVVRLEEVDSTNEYAKELIGQGAKEGTLVISGIQTGGKGRLDRIWESPKGGLWISVALKPKGGLVGDKLGILPLMAGCAVAKAVNAVSGLDTRLKWPNDVMINGKKMSGILAESIIHDDDRWVIIGMGINVNNNVQEGYDFSSVSTSIIEEKGSPTEIEQLEIQLICELERLYNMAVEGQDKEILNEWRSTADTLGRKVLILRQKDELAGIAKDIDDKGALILELEDGSTEIVLAGDCQHIDV